MITSLKEIDPVVANQVDEAMLLGKTAGPYAGGEIFERFRLANTCKGIAQDGLNQIERPQGSLTVDFDPVAEVFPNSGWNTASLRLLLKAKFFPELFRSGRLSLTF